MKDILEIALRIVICAAVLIIFAKIDGAKQISQLTFFDYIVGITVGSIAGALCIDDNIPIHLGVLAIVLFMLLNLLISFVTNKSIVLRRLLIGEPIFLLAKGEVLYDGLKRSRFDLNDLLRELRVLGYFDISEINYAILEPSGALSVLPKAYARPPKVSDMALKLSEDVLKANVVIDGKALEGNLRAFNKDTAWLESELKKQGYMRLKDVVLATLDENELLTVFLKKESGKKHNSLM